MKLNGLIYAGAKALDLDDDARRGLYFKVVKKTSLGDMNDREKLAVVDQMRKDGFQSKPAKGALTGPYAKKLQALWIAAWNLGIVKSKTDAALLAFVKRQTGIERTQFLRDPKDADRVVEALKAWMAREAGVDWNPDTEAKWRKNVGAQCALAQHIILGREEGDFKRLATDVIERTVKNMDDIKNSDWQKIQNNFGEQIRALKK